MSKLNAVTILKGSVLGMHRVFFVGILLLLLALPAPALATSCGITPPALSISQCQQINIQNTQSSAIAADTQIPIQYPANSYTSYEAANMMNYLIYNSVSGTTAQCWLEGNTLNEQQASNLYTSANLLYWCKIPDSIGAGATDSNWYFGISATSTDFYANPGADIGAAPQLYCASGCPATSYAGVDNGNAIFNFYDNFSGTSLNANKWVTGANGGTATVNNGLSLIVPETVGDYIYVASSSTIASQSIIVEANMNGNNIQVGGYRMGFGLVPSQTYLLPSGTSQDHVSWQGTELATTEIVGSVQKGTSYVNPIGVTPVDNNYHIWGLGWLSGVAAEFWYNGYPTPTTTTSDVPADTTYLTLSYYAYSSLAGTPTALEFQYIRTRTSPHMW